jgi:putative transposase
LAILLVPSSAAVQAFLDLTIRRHRAQPDHLITDHGKQFTAKTFARWCRRRSIRRRFGAVGKYGSIAVIERFIRTMKNECTRRILVPGRLADFHQELTWFAAWYNAERPHSGLGTRTPDEVYFGMRPACRAPRLEPRSRWPRRAPCAGPNTLIRGRPGATLELDVRFLRGRQHLPVVEIRRAA